MRILLRRSALVLEVAALALAIGCSSSREIAGDASEKEYPKLDVLDSQEGIASYYHNKFQGRSTASGERYDKRVMTAAHNSYPFGTYVKVTAIGSGTFVIVRINDRGPRPEKRIIDLSYAAARRLDMLRAGLIKVRLEVLAWGGTDDDSD